MRFHRAAPLRPWSNDWTVPSGPPARSEVHQPVRRNDLRRAEQRFARVNGALYCERRGRLRDAEPRHADERCESEGICDLAGHRARRVPLSVEADAKALPAFLLQVHLARGGPWHKRHGRHLRRRSDTSWHSVGPGSRSNPDLRPRHIGRVLDRPAGAHRREARLAPFLNSESASKAWGKQLYLFESVNRAGTRIRDERSFSS